MTRDNRQDRLPAKPLRTEAEGKQDYDWGAQRGAKVVNDNVTNGLGTPVVLLAQALRLLRPQPRA